MYKTFFKDAIDFLIAIVGFIVLSPLFILITIILFISNNGKPFFTQIRPGRNQRLFTLMKFKTMNDRKDPAGNLLSDGERLTAMGKFVRRTSLDEIPQLLNVIKGDMSLVGPRPLMVEYLPYYNSKQKRRHEVKPGITGWAQINGRNSISWEDKFDLDVYYVDNISFILDMKILILTAKKIFDTTNISPVGHATMPKFSDEQKNALNQEI